MLRTLLFLREAYVGRVAPKGWGSFTQSIIQPHVAVFSEPDVILSHHPARAYLYPTWVTGKEEKFRDNFLLEIDF